MLWHQLTNLGQLQHIKEISQEQSGKSRAVLIFKHSTRCNISAMALSRLENKWQDTEAVPCYYLDLLNHRNISDQIALDFGIPHQSPQVLLIKNGKCIYHQSHSGISAAEILEIITKQIQ